MKPRRCRSGFLTRTLLLVVSLLCSASWSVEPQKSKINPGKQQPKAEQRGTENAPLFVRGEVTARKDAAEAAQDADDRKVKEEVDASLAKYTGYIAALTAALATGTIILAFFTWRLWRSTKELVITTDKTARTHERAHLFGGLTITGRPYAVMTCRNEGRTLAFVTSVQWGVCDGWAFEDGQPVSTAIKTGSVESEVLVVEEIVPPGGARANVTFMRHEIPFERILGKVVFGRINYEDAFRDPHYGTFKFRIEPVEDPGTFRVVNLPGCYSDWA